MRVNVELGGCFETETGFMKGHKLRHRYSDATKDLRKAESQLRNCVNPDTREEKEKEVKLCEEQARLVEKELRDGFQD